MLSRLRDWLRHRRRDLVAAFYVLRDPRTPARIRTLIVAALAYALSPLDLVPDVVPLMGYLDDAVLAPLGLALSLWLAPREVVAQARGRAEALTGRRVLIAAAAFVLLWIGAIALFAWWLANRISG